MIPKRVVLENFLSFGTPATEVEFTGDEPLWVLGGPNGVGKSAVFDGITYCLFGCHRGGASDHTSLIRHGANGFRVEFEFAFDDTDYRITRNRGGRTTQKVERRDPGTGEWRPVPGVNSVADVKAWSERTLGVEFEAFKASVLLRQGEADAIITAGGTERLRILKKIIDAERFEELSKKVHTATADHERTLKVLRTRRDGMTAIAEGEVTTAREALSVAEAKRAATALAFEAAGRRVAVSERWAQLDADWRRVDGQIAAADARARDGDRIRADTARLYDLAAVPILHDWIAARAGAIAAAADVDRLRAEVDRLVAERDGFAAEVERSRQTAEDHRQRAGEHSHSATALRTRIGQDTALLATADRRAGLCRQLADDVPPDLSARVAAAREAATRASDVATAAGHRRTEVDALLGQAENQRKRFEKVDTGVTCSQCGQVVSAEHADAERGRLAETIGGLRQRLAAADAANGTARAELGLAATARDDLAAAERKRDALTDQVRGIDQLGAVPEPWPLRQRLAAATAEVVRMEAAVAEETAKHDAAAQVVRRADADRKAREVSRVAAQTRADAAGQAVARADTTKATLLGRLGPTWAGQADAITAAEVAGLQTELNDLTASGVAAVFLELVREAALRDEWAGRRDALIQQIEAIDPGCRRPPADARREAGHARQEAADANTARDTAKTAADTLAGKLNDFRTLVTDIAAAEHQCRVHGKLDDALGKDGLQRELVRTAEREIVRHANDTVKNLSDGDLSIELDKADGADEAFALKVRRADDPTPIGVNYLSGSQKFRVAVSVALAIGRFAAGHSRRLESVIIDEGFGSLDRDGLAGMADELNRLKQYLRRIILVSHQEEFADRFPVVIKLSRGATGTVAEAVRR